MKLNNVYNNLALLGNIFRTQECITYIYILSTIKECVIFTIHLCKFEDKRYKIFIEKKKTIMTAMSYVSYSILYHRFEA